MKHLFQARNVEEDAEIQVLMSGLEEAGMPCIVRNENLAVARGEIPFSECFTELWILNDEDYPKAMELVTSWRESKGPARASWVCAGCQETIEGQFTSCWQCGRENLNDEASHLPDLPI
jgi:Putative prokaryotic signal transducing protein